MRETFAAYTKVTKKITEIANGYCRVLASQWLIGHDGDAPKLHNSLKPSFDKDDRFFVVKLTGDWMGWLSPDAVSWLNGEGRKLVD